MNNMWNQLTEKEKEAVREAYKNAVEDKLLTDKVLWETLFGKDNLDPKPVIKTWKDYLEAIKDEQGQSLTGELDKVSMDSGYIDRDSLIFRKVIATFKIAKLIELGYGGMITDDEWKNADLAKYVIDVKTNTLSCEKFYFSRTFIAFHTKTQRDEFLKNNEQLCKDYYMI